MEGIHLTIEYIKSGGEVVELYINEKAKANPEINRILELCQTQNTIWVTKDILSGLSNLSSPPELIVLARRTLTKETNNDISCLLLEDIQDPGNMGTILRSAAASGIKQVCLSASCTDPYANKVLRSGMGSHFVLSIHEQIDLAAFMIGFRGKRVVTSISDKTKSIYDCELDKTTAFVFGNEGLGVTQRIANLADELIKIPMLGKVESLNVAMAVSIVLFERVRQIAQGIKHVKQDTTNTY